MPAIRIYESALCCDTGVCGPEVDQSLVEVTADLRHLQGLGADIARHNLASDPTAFTKDDVVRGYMHTVGSSGLPLTVVDGVTVATGTYPSREQLLRFAGLDVSGAGVPASPAGGRDASAERADETGAVGTPGCCGA